MTRRCYGELDAPEAEVELPLSGGSGVAVRSMFGLNLGLGGHVDARPLMQVAWRSLSRWLPGTKVVPGGELRRHWFLVYNFFSSSMSN